MMRVLETGNGARVLKSKGIDCRPASREEIPLIDLEPMFTGDAEAKAALAAEIRRACTDIGFLYIKNHHVPQEVIDATFTAAHDYFALGQEEKMANHVTLSSNNRGYAAMLEENTDPNAKGDMHESFDIALDVPADDPDIAKGAVLYGPNQWPEGHPEFRAAMERYHAEMLKLGKTLMRSFALALDLEETFFDELITKPLATQRVLHYPPQEGAIDESQIGIGAHSDYECVTILAQDEIAALQVLNKDGEWIEATPIPGTFVVNIGDQMARWTNDLFASTIHRAVNRSGRERYSIPFFLGPNYFTTVEALPGSVSADRPAKYPPILAGEYVNQRFEETFEVYASKDKTAPQG